MTSRGLVSKPIVAQENERLAIQVALDSDRTAKQRNADGQFATPPTLAKEIVEFALQMLPYGGIDFLEPSCGSGAFFSALLNVKGRRKLRSAVGVELDPRFASAAQDLWGAHGLQVVEGDFTQFALRDERRFNFLIANPPYVRHHHLDGEQKSRLIEATQRSCGISVSGLAGLYVHFVLLSSRLLAPGAVSAWLIPTEFMDVNYGRALREYLASHVTLLRIHRFDPEDVQFDDALVSSSVVVFRNEKPQGSGAADFSFGGTLVAPRERSSIPFRALRPSEKWSHYYRGASDGLPLGPTIGDLFKIQRGIATGSNSVFILPRSDADELGIRDENLRPILPSPRFLGGLVVDTDRRGYPCIEDPLTLIDCRYATEEQLEERDPVLYKYFLDAASPETREGYLIRKRSPWFRQEQREAAPYVCTYMGRGRSDERPFRFIWNRSRAIATNLYLMIYPRGVLADFIASDEESARTFHEVWLGITGDDLRRGGRVYGGGLHKMEPRELANMSAEAFLTKLPSGARDQLLATQQSLNL